MQITQPSNIGPTIAIIGGGVSGALTAYHLAQNGAVGRIIVIDPRPNIGLGLAYSTPVLRHLLNVPAGKISAMPDDADHFLRWLRIHHDPAATAETFAPRAVFGEYVQSMLESSPTIQHVQRRVIDCRIEADQSAAVLALDDGQGIRAERVVLALGNFDPAPLPGIDPDVAAYGTYRHDAWHAGTYAELPPNAPITLIGTGLTAVDVLLRLREQGHRGLITAISRHAVFPYRHHPHPTLPTSSIPHGTPATCIAYLRAIRKAIDGGANWRSVIDSLRASTNALWLALPHEEQRRFKRHLQRRWDVVRHRMAPPIADALDAERAAGTLLLRHGHLVSVMPGPKGATVTIQHRERLEAFAAFRVINCTGPGMNYRRVGSELLDGLFDRGAISVGPHGTGLRCDDNGAILDAVGRLSRVLFNLGPGRLGTLLESIAVPEIRGQAVALAKRLSSEMSQAAQLATSVKESISGV